MYLYSFINIICYCICVLFYTEILLLYYYYCKLSHNNHCADEALGNESSLVMGQGVIAKAMELRFTSRGFGS